MRRAECCQSKFPPSSFGSSEIVMPESTFCMEMVIAFSYFPFRRLFLLLSACACLELSLLTPSRVQVKNRKKQHVLMFFRKWTRYLPCISGYLIQFVNCWHWFYFHRWKQKQFVPTYWKGFSEMDKDFFNTFQTTNYCKKELTLTTQEINTRPVSIT